MYFTMYVYTKKKKKKKSMVKLKLQKFIILGILGGKKMDKIKRCLQCGREVSQILWTMW